jgi:hypothetical protein
MVMHRKRTLRGALYDGYISSKRYFVQRFLDKNKQSGVDLLIGETDNGDHFSFDDGMRSHSKLSMNRANGGNETMCFTGNNASLSEISGSVETQKYKYTELTSITATNSSFVMNDTTMIILESQLEEIFEGINKTVNELLSSKKLSRNIGKATQKNNIHRSIMRGTSSMRDEFVRRFQRMQSKLFHLLTPLDTNMTRIAMTLLSLGSVYLYVMRFFLFLK